MSDTLKKLTLDELATRIGRRAQEAIRRTTDDAASTARDHVQDAVFLFDYLMDSNADEETMTCEVDALKTDVPYSPLYDGDTSTLHENAWYAVQHHLQYAGLDTAHAGQEALHVEFAAVLCERFAKTYADELPQQAAETARTLHREDFRHVFRSFYDVEDDGTLEPHQEEQVRHTLTLLNYISTKQKQQLRDEHRFAPEGETWEDLVRGLMRDETDLYRRLHDILTEMVCERSVRTIRKHAADALESYAAMLDAVKQHEDLVGDALYAFHMRRPDEITHHFDAKDDLVGEWLSDVAENL